MRVRLQRSGLSSLVGVLALLAGGALAPACNLSTEPPAFTVDTMRGGEDTVGADVVGADTAAPAGDDGSDGAGAGDVGDAADDTAGSDVDARGDGVDTGGSAPDEGTLRGDVVLTSVESAALYDGVKIITGDLVIEVRAAEQVTLPNVERVDGSLVVVGAADVEVTGLISLPRLVRVGLNVTVAHVQEGAVLDLPVLAFVGGHLDVSHGALSVRAPALTDVNGDLRVHDVELRALSLGALATIGGSLRLGRFSVGGDLSSLDLSLPVLARLDGDLELWSGPSVRVSAPRLVTLGGDLDVTRMGIDLSLPALAHVGGDVRLENLDVAGLELRALEDVGGEVRAVGCGGAALETLDLEALATVGGSVDLLELDDVVTVALDGLRTLGGRLRVSRVPALALVNAPALTAVPTDLDVSWNGDVTLVLPQLAAIAGELSLQGNAAIDAQLGALTSVGGNVLVTDTRLEGLGAGKLASVGRSLRLIGVESELATVSFPALGRVAGDVELRRVLGASSFTMNAVTAVGTHGLDGGAGDLAIVDNEGLTAFGFALLADVAGDLTIRGNPRLPRAVIDAYVVQMMVGGASVVCGNLGDPACP